MNPAPLLPEPEPGNDDPRFPRRRFLEGMIATGALAAVWPALAQQPTLDAWEETDSLCQVPLEPAQYDYELDPLLPAFIELSETLTGASNLDRHLASQYLERFAAHPQLTKALPLLIKAYQGITPGTRPSHDDVQRVIVNDAFGTVRSFTVDPAVLHGFLSSRKTAGYGVSLTLKPFQLQGQWRESFSS